MRAPLLLVALLALLLASAVATPSAAWTRVRRFDDLSASMQLTIGIRQQRVAELEHIATAVSTPHSGSYRQHLSLAAIDAMLAPAAESLQAVREWLQQAGVPVSSLEWSGSGEWLSVHTTVAGAEKLLGAEYHVYEHTSGKRVLRCEAYTLPVSVRGHVDVVGPTTRFPALHTPLVSSLPPITARLQNRHAAPQRNLSACDSGKATPDCIRERYQLFNASAPSGLSSAAVTGFLEEYILQSDLDLFAQKYDTQRVGFVPLERGANQSHPAGVESSLDIQYMAAMTHGIDNITFWYESGRQPKDPENEPFLRWLALLANTTNPPLVISTSYGDDEGTVDYDYAQRVNVEFMKAGARGISLLYSSGDSGAGCNANRTAFVPTFPAGSPWVTAVGATELTLNPLGETAVSFSSGGFSNIFPTPDYQKTAVSDYLTKYGAGLPDQKLWNASGRAFPDVAALGVAFPIIVAGREVHAPADITPAHRPRTLSPSPCRCTPLLFPTLMPLRSPRAHVSLCARSCQWRARAARRPPSPASWRS